MMKGTAGAMLLLALLVVAATSFSLSPATRASSLLAGGETAPRRAALAVAGGRSSWDDRRAMMGITSSSFAVVLLPRSGGSKRTIASSSSSTRRYSSVAAQPPTGTSSLPEGITKTVTRRGNGPPVSVGDVATVRYRCYVPATGDGAAADAASSSSTITMPFAKSEGQKVVVGDGVMIDGWEMALQTMRGGERSIVRIADARYGYGSSGVPPFVPPNSEIEVEMEVLQVEAGVDLGTIASADPLKPRTPASIAAAYNTRRELAALEEVDENKEGLEALWSKFQSFYFFGFFEGETGEKAPWYLRPSITFPLAFAVVGAAFYVSFSFGAITERGSQITDELDEIIVSSAALRQAVVVAFLSMVA